MENKQLPADVQSEYEFYKAQYEAMKQKEDRAQHPGIGWVKATERLPKEAGQITWRWLDKEAAYSGFDGTAFIYDKGGARVDMLYAIEIEWLDESPTDYQQLKEKVEKMEKALKKINDTGWVLGVQGCINVAHKALTPKTGEDGQRT